MPQCTWICFVIHSLYIKFLAITSDRFIDTLIDFRNEDRKSKDDSTYKREGNVYKFKQDDDDDDDEDKTWNGNSTQQM